jgi:lipopolysaccharide export system protein LptA
MGVGLTPAIAEQATEKASKTTITADTMSYDYKRSIAIFQDNVIVIDPQVKLEADALTVLFGSTNEIKSVTAVGNVRIKSDDKAATCNKAIYLAQSGEILLTGNARLMRDNDTLEGKQITFWLNEEKVLCKPGRLIIYSDQERSGTDVFNLGDDKKK